MHTVRSNSSADLSAFLSASQARVDYAEVARRRTGLRQTLAGLLVETTAPASGSRPDPDEPVLRGA
ncbi:hypothetical protein [Nocardioides pakistanensis]